jgi:hypothetical protein
MMLSTPATVVRLFPSRQNIVPNASPTRMVTTARVTLYSAASPGEAKLRFCGSRASRQPRRQAWGSLQLAQKRGPPWLAPTWRSVVDDEVAAQVGGELAHEAGGQQVFVPHWGRALLGLLVLSNHALHAPGGPQAADAEYGCRGWVQPGSPQDRTGQGWQAGSTTTHLATSLARYTSAKSVPSFCSFPGLVTSSILESVLEGEEGGQMRSFKGSCMSGKPTYSPETPTL